MNISLDQFRSQGSNQQVSISSVSILSIGNAYNSQLKQIYFTNRKRLAEQLLNIYKFDQANQQGAELSRFVV